MKTPLTFILNADWEVQKSGAATFTRALLGGLNSDGVEFKVVKMRGEDISPQKEKEQTNNQIIEKEKNPSATIEKGNVSSLRIFLGYFLELLRDCWHLWRSRASLRHRTIVVNEFGCEVIPIAARIMFPFARIVALAHTHPGTGEYANHPVRRFVERICFRAVSDVIYNSEALKEEWGKVLCGIDKRHALSAHKGNVIHYGIDKPDLSVPDDYPDKENGSIDLLCASRFVRWKGHRELIEAFRKSEIRNQKFVKARHALSLRLILVGDGPELEVCKEYAAGNENVIFMGARDNAARYFNGADIGIQLSIEPEAFGLVFLEAMSRGMPVIGTKIGGIPEVVADGGLLVDAGDIDAAADAIEKLVGDEGLRKALGEKGRRRWKEAFTVERMVNNYIAFFNH